MGNEKKTFLEKKEKHILKVDDKKIEEINYSSKKRVTYNLKGTINTTTTETKFYQYGNKVSIFETVKEVDEETVNKK